MFIKIYEDNPNIKEIEKVIGVLNQGGVIIYPTDTVYGLGCDINNSKAIERIARIKGVSAQNPDFSLICYNLSQLTDFTKQVNNTTFKLMKKNLPGPFTFILDANNKTSKLFKGNKKTIGIRIPENNIIREIVKELGRPIISTSIHDDDVIIEYTTDPELIYEKYMNQVDLVIDGGFGNNEASTVVNCTNDEIEIVREGLKELVY